MILLVSCASSGLSFATFGPHMPAAFKALITERTFSRNLLGTLAGQRGSLIWTTSCEPSSDNGTCTSGNTLQTKGLSLGGNLQPFSPRQFFTLFPISSTPSPLALHSSPSSKTVPWWQHNLQDSQAFSFPVPIKRCARAKADAVDSNPWVLFSGLRVI